MNEARRDESRADQEQTPIPYKFEIVKKQIGFRIVIGSVAMALSSCATTGNFKVSEAPPPAQITVAVRQFTGGEGDGNGETASGLADFERIFLSGRLVERLELLPSVSGAYFATGPTVATDFVVDGSIVESNGRDLSLAILVERLDGARILKKTYRLRHEPGEVPAVGSNLNQYLDSIAADISAAGRESTISLPEARAKAYADNAALSIEPKVLRDAAIAAEIEREEILDPLTGKLVPMTRASEELYVEWQAVSAPLVDARDAARREKLKANVNSTIMLLAGVASTATSMQYARQGDMSGVQLANQNTLLLGEQIDVQAAEAEVAENRIRHLTETLRIHQRGFSVGQQRKITVKIYDKVLELSGTQAEQLAELREVVREQLNGGSRTEVAHR